MNKVSYKYIVNYKGRKMWVKMGEKNRYFGIACISSHYKIDFVDKNFKLTMINIKTKQEWKTIFKHYETPQMEVWEKQQ